MQHNEMIKMNHTGLITRIVSSSVFALASVLMLMQFI